MAAKDLDENLIRTQSQGKREEGAGGGDLPLDAASMWEIRAAQKSRQRGPWWIVTAKPIKVLQTTAAALVPTGKRGRSGRHGSGDETVG